MKNMWKKQWHIYKDLHLIGLSKNTYEAIKRVEFELGRKLQTIDGQDVVKDGLIKGGNIIAKFERVR